MYGNAAILAAFAFVFAAISGRVDRSWLSGPIVFTAAGVLLGPAVLGVLNLNIEAESLRLLAELTLALVLFTDAAKTDIRRLPQRLGVPERLLLVGLPLTIILGGFVASVMFPTLELVEVALIAAILAPTDAALGKPVVTNSAVPPDTREALSIESGLNDGICVPIVILLVGVAKGLEIKGGAAGHVIMIIIEEIGIGAAVGVSVTLVAFFVLRLASRRDWVDENWGGALSIALAIACFTTAQALGGSGFIACFVGGLTLSAVRQPRRHELLRGAESTGEVLSLLTWTVFGAAVVAQIADAITWVSLAYAVVSLTVIRMLPVFLSLTGTKLKPADRLFIGWFGPRGLASIVFGIIILDAGLPNSRAVEGVIVCTVLLSVVAHGVTANPLVNAFAKRWNTGRELRQV